VVVSQGQSARTPDNVLNRGHKIGRKENNSRVGRSNRGTHASGTLPEALACCRSVLILFFYFEGTGLVPGTMGQAACKPGSVPATRSGDGRWPFLWGGRCRTPRATYPDDWPGNRPSRRSGSVVPTWSCSRWGLPCRRRRRRRGALLPHPFTVTRRSETRAGRLLSVALSLGSPPPGVTRHRVSMEPGLSSPGKLPGAAIRPPGPS
jgi:hypothetical protein